MRYRLPKIEDNKDFEELCCDIMNIWYPNGYHIFGRSGQEQYGIDIIPDHVYAPLVQCKNYLENNKSTISKFIKEIERDYSTANNSISSLKYSEFIVFTALNRDVNISLKKLYLQGDKIIRIYFWEEITSVILSHSDLLKTYYPIYFNYDDFETMINDEDDYIKKTVELINNNISTLRGISLTTTKSSVFYDAVDFYEAYLEIDNQFALCHSKKTDYIRHFFMIVDDLLYLMANYSVPNADNPEERVLNRNIPDTVFDDFRDKIDIAKKLLEIIKRLERKNR